MPWRNGFGNFVSGACENPECEEHMITKRYPTILEYIENGTVISYVTLTMQCPSCGNCLPPK